MDSEAAEMKIGIESLATALEREHREIDAGIEEFTIGPPGGRDTSALTRAIHALRRHIYLEEEFLFPPLREAGLTAPVFVMLREHAEIWATLDDIEREIDDVQDADLELCRELIAQLQNHNFKEERVLYPQADRILSAPAGAELRAAITAERLPEGWVCQMLQS